MNRSVRHCLGVVPHPTDHRQSKRRDGNSFVVFQSRLLGQRIHISFVRLILGHRPALLHGNDQISLRSLFFGLLFRISSQQLRQGSLLERHFCRLDICHQSCGG